LASLTDCISFDIHKICQKMFLFFCGWWVIVSILESCLSYVLLLFSSYMTA
jgi:hypothetical protein